MSPSTSYLVRLVTGLLGVCWCLVDNTLASAEYRIHEMNATRLLDQNDASNACKNGSCFCNDQTKIAKCVGQSLTNIPDGLPTYIEHLDLAFNYLTALTEEELQRFPNLVTVNFSHNNIAYISSEAFIHNTKLETADLQGNQLGDDSGLMMFLCSMSSLIHLNLMGNGIPNTKLNLMTLCTSDSLQILDIENNNISTLPLEFLNIFPNLQSLNLGNNTFTELPVSLSYTQHTLQTLSLANNRINVINCSAFENLYNLETLDLGYNIIEHIPERMCSEQLRSLKHLILSGNLLNTLTTNVFRNCTYLSHLELSHLPKLIYLEENSLSGLTNLLHLNLAHCARLEFIHADAFHQVSSLQTLDLSYCRLHWLHEHIFDNFTSLTDLRLEGNPWHCDCDLKWLPHWMQHWQNHSAESETPSILCTSPPSLVGSNFMEKSVSSSVECEPPAIITDNNTLWFRIGVHAIMDCETKESPRSIVQWITPKKNIITYHPAYPELPAPDDPFNSYHDDHLWHHSRAYHHDYADGRFIVLRNGSLYIDYVTRKDAGNYTCYVQNSYGNSSAIIHVRLDYGILQWIKIYTTIIGFISAFAFFFITITISTIRYLAHKCSSKERRKRKSIREVLNSLYDFKTVQIDRFCAYKTAKINKLSAFKSDKIHKLVAFKTAKVGKLRTYKQVTMASIFHHLEKMREHYHSQMVKVKDNCTQQVEKLRDNYGNQISKFKDYKSEKIERIRDNYNCQVLKIRDYRTQQLNKLRDQYKVQQQHLFKLMELLDIGNCLNVVEAECMRTESMLFNPNISFDLEAQPVHVTRDLHFSDDSEYLTAGSQTDHSDDMACTFSVQEGSPGTGDEGCSKSKTLHKKATHKRKRKRRKKHQPRPVSHKHTDSMSSDSSAERALQLEVILNTEPPPPPSFSCELLDLKKMPLEELLVTVCGQNNGDQDDISMYQTPPLSAHHDIEAATTSSKAPHVVIDTDNISSDYESVRQSPNGTPLPGSSSSTLKGDPPDTASGSSQRSTYHN